MSKGEKVLVLHEAEASAVYDAIVRRLKAGPWDLSDESVANEALFLRHLRDKLEEYLDKGTGKDVHLAGECQSKVTS